MWDNACRWARPRLPLLAGGELAGGDRRKLERHLIACAPCRVRLESLSDSLGALRMLGAAPASSTEAPSLWPALARQIREAKHPEPAPAIRPLWIGLGLGVAASLTLAVGVATLSSGPSGRKAPGRSVVEGPRPTAAPPAPSAASIPAESTATVAEASPSKSEPETATPGPSAPAPSRGNGGGASLPNLGGGRISTEPTH